MSSAIISLLVIVIAVYILAVITDEFFIVSLDQIAARWKLPSDVAGASLMAVGSSAPELFIALSAVFLGGEHGSVGIGTIVGSAVFNILVITGAAAAIVGNMDIKGGGVERDIIFYLGSVALLLWVFRDGQVTLLEAISFVAAYVIYLVILARWGEGKPYESAVKQPETEKEHKPTGVFGQINHVIATVFGFIARDPHKNYVWAMIASIAAIAGISFILVDAAVDFSNAIGLPPVIVSLTLLAAGTSAPDLIASVSVARDGRGEMAVANAVGSDIFDVLVGLGLPWLITLAFLHPFDPVPVDTEGLITSIFILSGTTVLLYVFLYTKRELSRIEGWILLLVYAVYVLWVIFANAGAVTPAA